MQKKIVILGGGISGLALLWFLKKNLGEQADISLFEKSERAGGWIHTIQKEGFSFEQGPQFIMTKGAEDIFNLIEALGLKKMAIGNNKQAIKRYIYIDGKMQVLPRNLFQLLFSPLAKGFIPGLIHDWREPPANLNDESIYDFISRRFNPDLANGLIGFFISAFTIGDLKKISMKSTMPSIWELEKKHGGVIRGMFAKKESSIVKSEFTKQMEQYLMFEFMEGLEMLPQALEKALKKNISLSCPAKRLKFSENKVEVEVQGQQTIVADHVFSTIPSYELANLLTDEVGGIASLLRSFVFNRQAVVNFGFRKQVIGKEFEGFGFSVSGKEKQPVLGALWASSLFPQMFKSSNTCISLMVGEDNLPKEFDLMNEKDFYDIAVCGLEKYLHIHEEPDASTVKIIKNGTPRFEMGHSEKVEKLKQTFAEASPHFTFLGNSYYEASISALVKNAKLIADEYSQRNRIL